MTFWLDNPDKVTLTGRELVYLCKQEGQRRRQQARLYKRLIKAVLKKDKRFIKTYLEIEALFNISPPDKFPLLHDQLRALYTKERDEANEFEGLHQELVKALRGSDFPALKAHVKKWKKANEGAST